MTTNNNGSGRAGISLSSLLGVVFIVLKLCGVIDWPWVWVLAPFWISILVFIVALALMVWLSR